MESLYNMKNYHGDCLWPEIFTTFRRFLRLYLPYKTSVSIYTHAALRAGVYNRMGFCFVKVKKKKKTNGKKKIVAPGSTSTRREMMSWPRGWWLVRSFPQTTCPPVHARVPPQLPGASVAARKYAAKVLVACSFFYFFIIF